MPTEASLIDQATGNVVFIFGLGSGHRIVVRHRPRVPVLDVPGASGDKVQFLGRKSRVGSVQRALATDGVFGGVLPPGFSSTDAIFVQFFTATGRFTVGNTIVQEITPMVVTGSFIAGSPGGAQSVSVVSASGSFQVT